MKKLFYLFMVMAFVPMLMTTGCKKEAETTEYELMTEYMMDNSMDLTDVLDGWITSASAVVDETDGTVPGRYVIDLRSAADYSAGHIKGAVNSTLANILTTAANSGGKQILVVCYTGQTAAHGTVALRLSGYPDAQVLKWGMSGWNNAFASKWLGNSGVDNGNVAIGNTNWIFPANITAATIDYDDPDISSTASDGAEILKERVTFMLDGGFNGIAGSEVLANPTNYFINNYWDLPDTEHYGHIAGSHRIKPLSLANGEISKLNPDETIVTYCWTGQTSSMVTAYLKVLGYNSKSIKFGANNLIYPILESHQYTAPTVDYIYE